MPNLAQEALAERMGASAHTVRQMETGHPQDTIGLILMDVKKD